MRIISYKLKILLYAAVGYAAAVLTSPILPEMISLLFPLAGAVVGLFGKRDSGTNLPPEVLPVRQEPPRVASPEASGNGGRELNLNGAGSAADVPAVQGPAGAAGAAREIGPEFAPVVEYLSILEDMIISEGRKDTLDNEIVEKSLALFARLQRIIPLLQELNNGEINHTVRRLILKDLNGVINPFLRLGGEAKTKNRRMLLNGLRDVDTKISDIASTIEHKDLMELQTKAELIHQRYSSSEL